MSAYNNMKELVDGFESMLINIMHSNKDEFVDYVQEQLYSGIDGNDKPLRPSYLTDPWFSSSDAGPWKNKAKSYMLWKKKITAPTPSYLGINSRGIQTPNLTITGNFYSSIRPTETSKGVSIYTESDMGREIEDKYGSNIFGISSYAKNYFLKYVLLKEINNYFKKYGQ